MVRELTEAEKKSIKEAFRQYRGDRISKEQKKIMRAYGIERVQRRNGHIYFSLNERKVYTSLTPGDRRTGKNLAKNLISLVEGTI